MLNNASYPEKLVFLGCAFMASRQDSIPFFLSRRNGKSDFSKAISDALVSGENVGKNVSLLIEDTEEFLRTVWTPRISNLQFQINGVQFQARYEPEGEAVKLQIWAVLGYLPYSVESYEKRKLLINILTHALALKKARFGLNKEGQIIVSYTEILPDIKPPTFIFVSLVSFLQEAMPFIGLIGECFQNTSIELKKSL